MGLPLLAWAASLPFGLWGAFTTGGSVNSLHALPLLLPAGLVMLGARLESLRAWRYAGVAGAMAVGLLFARVMHEEEAPVRPQVAEVKRGERIAAERAGRVWMPWNPLATWFSDGQFYHAEDGIYVRFIAGHPVGLGQARAGVPSGCDTVALPSARMQWGAAMRLAGEPLAERLEGPWQVYTVRPIQP